MSEISRKLHLGHGAYADMQDLIRIRHAAKEVKLVNKSKTSNPLSGLLSSRFRGRGIDFAEVRHYQPGDDVRTIDWRVTARTQIPHTKLFQEEKERPVLILVDQSQSMFFGSQKNFKSVLAAQLTALLAWLSLEQGDRVGGIVFADGAHKEVRPRRNKHSVLQLLNDTHEFNHQLDRNHQPSERAYLTEALLSARRVAKHGSSIYIISDFLKLDDTACLHLRQLAQHNQVAGFHICDELERKLPLPDIYQITNGADKMQINTISKKSRNRYEELYEQRFDDIKSQFEKIKAPFISAASHENPVDILTKFSQQGLR